MSSRLSVVQVIGNAVIGGSEMHLVSLVEGLPPEHVDMPLVVVPDTGPFTDVLENRGIPFRKLPVGTGDLECAVDLRAVDELAALFDELRPDIVHCHLFPAQLHGSLAAYACGIPAVTTMHRLEPMRPGSVLLPRLTGAVTIAVCEAVRDVLVRYGVPKGLVSVIYNAVIPERFQPSPDEAATLRRELGCQGAPLVGSVARLSPEKGVDVLVKAVPALARDFPDLRVLIAGYGPWLVRLRRLAATLGVAETAVLLGPRDDIHHLNQALDVFVLASHTEACPLALLDAMAVGVACVATRVGGVPEIVTDGVDGVLVPPGDERAIEDAVRQLLRDPELRSRLGAAARETVARRFGMDRMVHETVGLYGALAQAPRPSAEERARRRARLPEIAARLAAARAAHGSTAARIRAAEAADLEAVALH